MNNVSINVAREQVLNGLEAGFGNSAVFGNKIARAGAANDVRPEVLNNVFEREHLEPKLGNFVHSFSPAGSDDRRMTEGAGVNNPGSGSR